jgi:leucyl-tRNA synthetase
MLAPFAPHVGEELWELLGHEPSIEYVPWPQYDENAIKVNEVEIVVQVCGKIKGRVMLPVDATEEQMRELALGMEAVQTALAGRPVRKVICVPGRIINVVG